MLKAKEIFSARNVAFFAVLLALTIVLQLFASAIPMFGVTLNFSLIPIILAGMFFGVVGGAFMGLASGLVIFISTAVMGMEASTAFLFQANPAVLTLTCLGKTTIAGAVSGFLYSLIAKKNSLVAAFVSALTVPVLNTGIYVLGMVIMRSDVALFLGTEAAANVVFVAVFSLIWLNFLLEIAVSVLFSPAIHRVVTIIEKRILSRKKSNVKESSASAKLENAEPAKEQTEQQS